MQQQNYMLTPSNQHVMYIEYILAIEIRIVQITHLCGKNLCTLDGNIIRLSNVSGAIRVNIFGFVQVLQVQ